MNDHAKLSEKAGSATHFYDVMLESCEKLFDNEIEQHTFEDQLRSMFGTKASGRHDIARGWSEPTVY